MTAPYRGLPTARRTELPAPLRRSAAMAMLIACLCAPASALIRENAGSSAGDALLRGGVGARPAALGGAYTAVAAGPLAIRYNPAALALVGRQSVFLGYDNALLDINRSDAAYARPWGPGSAGAMVSVIDYGTITRTTTTNKFNAGTFGASEYLARAGYGWMAGDRLALGGTVGVFQLNYEDEEATGFAADAGLLYWPAVDGVRLAAAVRNLGRGPRFFGATEELPVTGVVGVTYRPGPWWLLALEYEGVRNQGGAVRAGIEFTPVSVLALRAGFDGRNDAGNGLSVGLGVAAGDLKLDYAYVPFGELDQSHRVSAEYAFGPEIPRPEPRGRIAPAVPRPAPEPPAVPPSSAASQAPAAPPQPLPSRPSRAPKDEPVVSPGAPGSGSDAPSAPSSPAPVAPSRPPATQPPVTPPAVAPAPAVPDRVATTPSGDPAAADQGSSMRRALPGDPAAPYLARAAEAAASGNEELEMSWYRRVLATWPDHIIAHYNLATLHYLRGEWRPARLHYLEVVTRDREDGEAWLYLAVAESRLGNRREAREALHRVLAIDPTNPWARRALGRP